MKKSKTTNALPRSFKLENYDGMDRLSPLEWLFQLEARYQLHSSLNDFIDCSHRLTDEEKKHCLDLIITDYFKNPFKLDRQYKFFSQNHGEDIEIFIYAKYEKLPQIVTSGIIRPMTIKDFHRTNRLYGELFHNEKNVEPFYKEVIKQHSSIDHLKLIPFYLDLSFSDEVLEKEFKRNLASLRANFKDVEPTKKLAKYKLANWASYKLLAYIDLYLWSCINDVCLKNTTLSKALQFEYSEDTLRKSVLPIMNRLFTPNGIELDDLENPTHLLDELAILALSNPENN
ncbi:DUF6387 family protein [Acinetobacter pseudolwoffii]|uniref:DUF6387 family protein n=1 Tax=Acinetobacter pseudolwoffii TaxID=2053287 RepID=UPI000C24FF44|nr:DUF6387 family protein [Acinetobacter pseudolwoffii]PJI36514.1 hypothetical protein CU318_03020 [Acinetobacter pseudolwoffii]